MILPVMRVCTLGRSDPGAHMENPLLVGCHDPIEEREWDDRPRLLARPGRGRDREGRIAAEGEGLESLCRTR